MVQGLIEAGLNHARMWRDGYVPVNQRIYLSEQDEFGADTHYDLILHCLGQRLFADGGLYALKKHVEHLYWGGVTARVHFGADFAALPLQFACAVRKDDLDEARRLARVPLAYQGAARLRVARDPWWYQRQARKLQSAYGDVCAAHRDDPDCVVDEIHKSICVKNDTFD